jgi:GNAT superfamily N-acetyltransferase
MPEIQIRPAIFEDIPHLVELDHDFVSDFVWQMDVEHPEDDRLPVIGINFRQIKLPRSVKVDYPRPKRALLDDWTRRSEMLVALLSGQAVGYCGLLLDLAPQTVWMTDLVVMRRVRRQGIGTALVLAALAWARQHNSQRLVLELQPKNYPAICLAQKLGFDFCGYSDRYFPNLDIGLFFGRATR